MYTLKGYFQFVLNQSLSIKNNCLFGRQIRIQATDGGKISIGKRVHISDHVSIIARGGSIIIGDDVFIGVGSIIASKKSVIIGDGSLIAEYVVIRDQDHAMNEKPIRSSGFVTDSILIGKNVWVGCKATILRGSTIGDHAVVGAHALVKTNVPDSTLAVGLPVRIIKKSR